MKPCRNVRLFSFNKVLTFIIWSVLINILLLQYQNKTTMITLCLALSFKGTKTEIAKMVAVTVILDLLTFASATF